MSVRTHDHRAYPGHVTQPWSEPDLVLVLQHPNIVAYVGVERAPAAIVVRFRPLTGVTLAELLAARGRARSLPRELALQVAAEAAEGLHFAHALRLRGAPAEFVHGHVGPEQIWLTTSGEVRLDGFADALVHAGEASPAAPVDLGALSPEQRRGLPAEARSDVYGLGATLQAMLGGELAPGDRALLDRALHPSPAERWPSMRAFGDALRAALPPAGGAERSTQLAALLASL